MPVISLHYRCASGTSHPRERPLSTQSGHSELRKLLLSGGSGSLAQRPEGDRVAQCLDRQQAVLPFAAGGAGEAVGGARFGEEREALPLRASLAAEAQGSGGGEGNADDFAEVGSVAVPADA